MSAWEVDRILLHGQERCEELGFEVNWVGEQGVREEEKGTERLVGREGTWLKSKSGRSGRIGEPREGWSRQWAVGKAMGEGVKQG